MIFGYDPETRTVIGMKVLANKETPGLGDKIDERKSDWVLGFNGKSLDNPPAGRWKVKRDGGDFDQFTGATITPRAIVSAVQQTLAYFQQQRDELFKSAADKAPSNEGARP